MSYEPLTTQLVAEMLQQLLVAFPSKHSERNLAHTAEVYRSGLRGVAGDALRGAVDVAIKTDNFFPKIARLRELALEWEKRNRVVAVTQRKESWDVCAICGAQAYERTGMAQDRDAHGELLWDGKDENGKPKPKMVPTPPRWIIDHNPRGHNVFRESEEAAG